MPKPRKHDVGLPEQVRRLPSGSYQLRDHGIIARKDATLDQIWDAYRAAISTDTQTRSLRHFADSYYASNNFAILSERSKQDYRECEKRPIVYFTGKDCTAMTTVDINNYLKERFKKAKRRANLELVWFRNVFGNAVEEGLYLGQSPAAPIKPKRLSREERKTNRAKKRLVSDEDYQAMLTAAPVACKVAMEIAYCTGCRPGDVLSLKRSDLALDGFIGVEESKTGHEYAKQITPRLAVALALANTIPGQPFGGWVIRNRYGNPYTRQGWHANWKRWKTRIPESQRFTFQEIRIKAISEAEGNKQEFSMHSNARMLGIYDRQLPLSPSHD